MATLRGSQANEAPETNDALVQEKQDSKKTATKRTRKSKAQVTTKASQSELSSVDTAISTETTGAAVSQEDQSLDPQEQQASADGKKVRKTAKATKAEAESKAAKATKAEAESKAAKATKASSKASKNSKASKVSSASTASTDSVICEDEGTLADSESSKVEGTNETAKASAKNVSGALSDTCNEGQAQAQEPTNSDNQDGMNAEANCDVTETELEKGKAKKTSKAAKKAKDQDDPMSKESIEAHAAKALDFNAPVLLVPIRHHSVAMGLHLPRIIDAYQPDFIAVEMPHICQDQVKHLANEKVVPPIAFFSYGTTKTIQLVPVNEDDPESALEEQEVDVGFRHIYPMLSYSPEYVALKEALKRNIEYQCIDLSSCEKDYIDYCMKKQQSQEILAQDHNQCSSDEKEFGRSSYYQELVKKSGDLSFEEFWDRNFEINALAQDTKTFLHNVYSYCYCIRKGISDEQELDMVQRELFMLKHITAAQKNYKRILVITGGMHSVALCDYLYYKKKKDKPLKFPKSKDNCFLIPYSFKATDVQSEYASGIVFPYYYHKLYQAISTSLSFGPDAKLLSGDDVGGYQAIAANSENFEYWNDPLSAICQLDTKISKAVLNEDEASADQADQANQADPNGQAGQAGSGKKKKKRKKHNHAAQGSITPAGRLFDVVNTIKELGSIKDQAKIKDSEAFSAKVAQVQSALGINKAKAKSQKALKVSYGTTVYNEAQQEALLSFKANQEQIINACDANNFFFARKVRDYRQNKMSTAVQVDCQVMLKGLASLRDKLAPSVHELIDAVKSTFIKEEYNDSHYILLNLLKALTTVPLGKVPLDVNVPPIWRDFVYKAKTFALKSDDQEVHKANIDIFKDEKNVLKGRFFAQVSYLCPGFEVDQYNRHHNANYIKRTETYTYRFTDHVVMSIIEAAEYGDTLELASEAKVKESLEQGGLSLVELCSLFKDCIDMGIERQYQRLQQLITNTIYHERNLSDIACSLDMLNSYGLIAKTTKDNQKVIDGLIKLVLKRALQVLTDTVDISDDELDEYIASLMKLDYYFNKYEYITKSYYELLFELSKDSDIGASLQGAYVSFLFKNKQITYDEFERFVDQFVYGSIIENNDCIGFFYAILKVSKASIFYRNGILQLLNAYIASLQGEEFLKVLVMLRRSFASFSKEEIYKVVTLLQKIHGIAQTKNIFEVTDAEFVQNRMYDRDMLAKMSAWLPVANILEAANLHKEQIATTGLVEQLTGQDLSRSTLLSNDKRPNLNAMSPGTGQGSGLGQAPGMVSSAGAGTSASASSGAGAGASSGAGALRGASKSLDDGGGELELNPDSL